MNAQLLPTLGAFRTIASRLLLWTLAVVVPIYAAALYLSFRAAAERLEADAVAEADQLAARLAAGLDSLIRPIEGGVRTIAFQIEEIDPPRSEYLQRIRGLLGAWPEIYGSTIAVEVRDDDPDASPFAPYLYRRDGEIAYSDLASENYAYRDLDWYRAAADGRRAVWSAPYFDVGGGDTWMVTYSVPYFRRDANGERELAGVVTADLDLDWVRRTATEVPLGALGVGWLSPRDPASDFIAPIGATAERLPRLPIVVDAATARAAGERMLADAVSFTSWRDGDRGEAYVAVRELGTLGWVLTLVLPRELLLAEARSLLGRQIGLGLVGLFVLLGAVSLVAAGIARPIRRLAAAVGGAADGDLAFALPEMPRRDEVGVLAAALRRLRDSLQEHVRLRAESLAEKARLEHELEISARLQQSMLPHADSLQALPPAVEIAVALQPARQVGGDLYDFFLLADGQVLFLVGDVSDKGIPAALFMARLSAMLRVLGAGGQAPDRLLREINGRLVEGNDTCMFVTAICGLLDPETGRYRLASAGHEPPLLRTVEGRVLQVAIENGAAIGIEAAADYPLYEGVIAPGDSLVLYTDGVTEAENGGREHFGAERLRRLLEAAADPKPALLIAGIVEQVASHAAGHHASDDLTALAIRYCPADVTARADAGAAAWSIAVGTSAAGLSQAQRRLRGVLEAREVDPGLVHDAELVAEEWLSNVVREGQSGKDNAARRLSVEIVLRNAGLALIFRDDGAAFDPLAAAEPDLDADLAARPVGGLGLHLIRELADSCRYERRDGFNVLCVELRPDRLTESSRTEESPCP